MADSFDTSQSVSFTKHAQGPMRRRSTTRQSYASWISTLANPHLGQHTTSPPPMTTAFDLQSPASTVRTIKHSQAPLKSPQVEPTTMIEEASPIDEGHERETEMMRKELMSPVEEVSENATSGPPLSPLRDKARSFVGGFVSSLRSLPRAVTHGQLYDRTSLSHRESTRASHASDRHHDDAYPPGTNVHGHTTGAAGYNLKYPEQPLPFNVPILLAPPFAAPHFRITSPHSLDLRGSKLGSEAEMETRTATGTENVSRTRGAGADTALPGIGSLLTELNSLPWIATSRVAVDYFPGVGRRGSQEKTSSSWYSVPAPATPSDISQLWRKLPEPWFPPPSLIPADEIPEDGGAVNAVEVADEDALQGDEEAEEAAPAVQDLKEELQARNRSLQNLRQVLEHQKMHISSLETQLEEVRRANEVNSRRQSMLRKSLRARDSIRVSRMSTRRTSTRVSRTSSLVMS